MGSVARNIFLDFKAIILYVCEKKQCNLRFDLTRIHFFDKSTLDNYDLSIQLLRMVNS